MNFWVSMRKGATAIHLSFNKSYAVSLNAYNMRLRTEPEVEIWLDLAPNLHKRNKQGSLYQDTKRLEEGKITDLSILQFVDRVLGMFSPYIIGLSSQPDPTKWRLTVNIDKEWSFYVRPEIKGDWLFLNVD